MGSDVERPVRRIVAVSPDDGSAIDLRNPLFAAVLSWAVPGLGQLYQGRTAKGSLFMAAILTTFVAGLWLGGGRVVYASWKPGDTRWAFVCQAGAGLVAMPAIVQSAVLNGPSRQPLVLGGGLLPVGFMAPPLAPGQHVSRGYVDRLVAAGVGLQADDFFDKPPWKQCRRDQLAQWHRQFGKFFEIGTLYTMLAGVLNLLVIYDAWAGPLGPTPEEKKRRDEGPETGSGGDAPSAPPADSGYSDPGHPESGQPRSRNGRTPTARTRA